MSTSSDKKRKIQERNKKIEFEKSIIQDMQKQLKIGKNIKDQNIDFFNYLCDLTLKDPWHSKKSICGLYFKKNKYFGVSNYKNGITLICEDTTGLIESVSYNNALKYKYNVGKKYAIDSELKRAMRDAISPDILKFALSHKDKIMMCGNCKKQITVENSHVDHDINHVSFKSLVEDFCKTKKKLPTDFDWNETGREFKKEDIEFKNEWINYHNKNSKLRMLCVKCNLSDCKYIKNVRDI